MVFAPWFHTHENMMPIAEIMECLDKDIVQ